MLKNGNKKNFQKELEKIIQKNQEEDKVPTLLLHSCCAPCSSYCLEYLSNFFKITIFYYNPNITEEEEYKKRVEEQKRFIHELPVKYPISFIEGAYAPEKFYQIAKGYEKVPEGGERCFRCYQLRLEESGRVAKENHFDYFTTTLSISPLKNAEKLNEIGEEISKQFDIPYLYSDFKKKEGYKRSILLSKEYQLYRQDYCGCIYSKREQEERQRKKL
ncbi:MAG: epoxyqueuosine reductase QueH [Lachnospiraceae bacterium]|nr:epoxyqueuosine reductase QueH [Lachnospiraceae bacterium]